MWEKVLWVLAIWTLAGLIAAIAFGRALYKDEKEQTRRDG